MNIERSIPSEKWGSQKTTLLRKRISMNIKFFFVLLVIAVFASACAPVQPAVPVTGESAPVVARPDSQAPRLWSGEVFLSDNDNPDYVQPSEAPAIQNTQNECQSEDSQPRRHGGCVE
jgi:hypothetical protein